MVTHTQERHLSPQLWLALATTIFAGIVTFLASLNLYLLEDGNPLTPAAYSASPLLRFSYDGVYLSALVAGIAICALLGYLLVRETRFVSIGLGIVSLLVIFAGFGGLLIHQPLAFLVLALIFAGLTLLSIWIGRALSAYSRNTSGTRSASLLGGCVSAGVALLVNLLAQVPHTLALNPVSHLLYMQGQIGDTHLNSVLIATAIELLSIIACLLSIGFALRVPRSSS